MNLQNWIDIGNGIWQTLVMTLVSSVFAYIIGLPLGVLIYATGKNGITPCKWVNMPLGFVVNILRSIPFLILAFMVMPIAKAITGSSLGWPAMIVVLTLASFAYIARLVEQSVGEVPFGEIEAARSMGCSPFQIIVKVILKESVPSLMTGAAIGVTTILSYSAMAGVLGGGGLGQIAINSGYYRSEYVLMYVAIAFIIVITQALQEFGLWLARALDKRRKS